MRTQRSNSNSEGLLVDSMCVWIQGFGARTLGIRIAVLSWS